MHYLRSVALLALSAKIMSSSSSDGALYPIHPCMPSLPGELDEILALESIRVYEENGVLCIWAGKDIYGVSGSV